MAGKGTRNRYRGGGGLIPSIIRGYQIFFFLPKKILIDIVMRMRYYDGVETGVGERKLPRYKLLSLRDPLQSDGYRGV